MLLTEYYHNNQDELEDMWEEHLSYMQNSLEHTRYMRNSERAFWEFVEEQMDKELNKQKETL